MTKPSDYFKKLDLAHLDANTAQFIREKILTLPNIDVLEGTKEFETIKAIVEESFPRAIGIEPVVVAPIVEEIPEPIIESVVEPIIDTKQEEIKTISGEIAEMTDLVDLLNEVVAENPQDLDSMDVLELYKETLVELRNKLKSLTEVITEAVSEVKDNIEEVKEVIKTDVVDTKGILTAPKKYKTEDGEEVLGYESDWNFGTKKHLGETVVYYSYKEGVSGKYSVLNGILHKGEIIYSEDKISNKEFENKFDSEKEALDFAYGISLDKEYEDKFSLGGVLLGAALGVAATLGVQKANTKNAIPVKKEKVKEVKEKWNDVVKSYIDKEGFDYAMDGYSDYSEVKVPQKFHDLKVVYLKDKTKLEKYITSSLSDAYKENVLSDIDKEGFDYTFDGYTDYKEIKDSKFHKLIKTYLKSKKELSDYIGLDKYENGGKVGDKNFAVYELSLGQPSNFYNEKENSFTHNINNATLYTEEEAKNVMNLLLKPRIEKYQSKGKNYSELHIGDLYKKSLLKKNDSKTKYVAIHESKDGYWTIASKPTTKENAEAMLGGTPKNEVGKVVTLEEAKAHKKTVGEEYLYEKGGSISNTTDSIIPNLLIELWLAVHEKRTDDYGSISEKLDSNKVPFYVQNKVSENATELRYKKAIDVLEVKDIVNKILSDYLNKEAEDILRVGKIETDIRNEEDNTRTIIVEIKPNKEYALIVKKNGDVIKLSKAQNELTLLLNKNKYENGGSIGFIPMDLENDLAIISKRGGLKSVKDVIGILNAMIDSGLTDEDLKTPPTKTGFQYQKALDKKTREILDKIEGNIGEAYKDDLKGNMPYSSIRLMVENKSSKDKNLLKEFKPFRKYQKFENGGEIKNIDKIKKSIGETVFNHISSLNKEQLEKQLKELKSEMQRDYFESNGKTDRYKKLNDEKVYILHLLERANVDYEYPVGRKVSIADYPKNESNNYTVVGHENYNEKYGWETIIENENEKVTIYENRLEPSIEKLTISSDNPLSSQLRKMTGDTWNAIDFESTEKGHHLSTKTPFRHIKTGRIFQVIN